MKDSINEAKSMRVVLLGGGGYALEIMGITSEINQSCNSSRGRSMPVAGILADK